MEKTAEKIKETTYKNNDITAGRSRLTYMVPFMCGYIVARREVVLRFVLEFIADLVTKNFFPTDE